MARRRKKLEPGYYGYDKMLSAIFHGHLPGGCSLLVPKVHFDKFGYFNTELRYMQDAEMWYRFLTGGVNFVCHRDDIGVLSRVHGQQVTVTGKHLLRKDLDLVGPAMVERLSKMPEKDVHLLKEYMYLCCKENSEIAAKKAYDILVSRNRISVIGKIKFALGILYGRIRPFLVRCYYYFFFRIKIKK